LRLLLESLEHCGIRPKRQKICVISFIINLKGSDYLPLITDMNLLINGIDRRHENYKYDVPDIAQIPEK